MHRLTTPAIVHSCWQTALYYPHTGSEVKALCSFLQSNGILRRDTLVLCLQFCKTGCHSDEPFVVVHIVRWFARQTSGSIWTGHGSTSTKPVLGFETLVQIAHHKTAIMHQTERNYKLKRGKWETENRKR